MDIEGISGAATVALTSTIIFVLLAKSWQLINRSVGSTPSFSGSIMREAAQRFREEFDRLNSYALPINIPAMKTMKPPTAI